MSAGPRRPTAPRRAGRLGLLPLALLAALALVGTFALERAVGGALHPRYLELVEAARTAARAGSLVLDAKERLGIAAPQEVDPNRTGLVGPEWSELVTTQGHLPAKRTVANPDFAAAVARELAALDLARGRVVVVAMSGSFPGANLAALAAVQALDLRAVPVSSLGASMWGATDPEMTWLDMERLAVEADVLETRSRVAVLGGDMGIGRDLAPDVRAALREAARDYGVPVIEDPSFEALVARVEAATLEAAGGADAVGAFVNVGGSMIAMGTCADAHTWAPGLNEAPLGCRSGIPGLMSRFSRRGVPVLHLLNVERLVIELGLPFDPVPLPRIGDDRRVYGAR